MESTAKAQRRRSERKAAQPCVIRIELKDGMGNSRFITADLFDLSDRGIGIWLASPLKIGSAVVVRGKIGTTKEESRQKATVSWCREASNGKFQAGLEFPDGRSTSSAPINDEPVTADPKQLDCYEILQLSPNADTETINRVYRLLAQRYHPDNKDTGDSEMFVWLTEAYHTLSDPERRASYDARYRDTKRIHWKIFDQSSAPSGQEAERRKRHGILNLLYITAMQDPENGFITVHGFEDMLGCPREHLEGALWYLRGKGWVLRGDNGRYKLTVQGVDEVERIGPTAMGVKRELLEAGPITTPATN